MTGRNEENNTGVQVVASNLNKKKMIIVLAAVAVLVIILSLFNLGNNKKAVNGGGNLKEIQMIITEDHNIIDVNGTKYTFKAESIVDTDINLANDKVALIVSRSSEDSEDLNELYYLVGEEQSLIARDVNLAKISDEGNHIAYIKDNYIGNGTGNLFIYDAEKDENILIDHNVKGYRSWSGYPLSMPLLSPNGDTVVYDVYDEIKEVTTSYIKVNDQSPQILGENLELIAVSNGGKYIYYYEKKEGNDSYNKKYELHVKTDDVDILLSKEDTFELIFNRDYSEAIFIKDNESYYFIDQKMEKLQPSYISWDGTLLLGDGVAQREFYGSDTFSYRIYDTTHLYENIFMVDPVDVFSRIHDAYSLLDGFTFDINGVVQLFNYYDERNECGCRLIGRDQNRLFYQYSEGEYAKGIYEKDLNNFEIPPKLLLETEEEYYDMKIKNGKEVLLSKYLGMPSYTTNIDYTDNLKDIRTIAENVISEHPIMFGPDGYIYYSAQIDNEIHLMAITNNGRKTIVIAEAITKSYSVGEKIYYEDDGNLYTIVNQIEPELIQANIRDFQIRTSDGRIVP